MYLNNKARIVTATALSLALGIGVCACAPNNQAAESSAATSEVVQQQEVSKEKTAENESSQLTVTFVNDSGYDISSLALRATGTQEFDATHTFDGIQLANGTSTTLTFKQIMQGGSPAKAYDILAKTPDNAVMVMSGVNLADLKEVSLKFDDSMSSVDNTNTGTAEDSNGQAGNTSQDDLEEPNQVSDDDDDIVTYDQQNQLG